MIDTTLVYFGGELPAPIRAVVDNLGFNVQVLPVSNIWGIEFEKWVQNTNFDAYLMHRFVAEHDLGTLPQDATSQQWHGKTVVVPPFPGGPSLDDYLKVWRETLEHAKVYRTLGVALNEIMLQINPMYLNSLNAFLLALRECQAKDNLTSSPKLDHH